MALLWMLGALLVLSGLYLFLIAPDRDAPQEEPLMGWRYAHRGLHDENLGVPENSLAAFSRAVENGYGMELDVQRTSDGQVVVFHDDTLSRMCGAPQRVGELTYEALKAYPLPDGSAIPLLSEVLQLVAGRTPIIVEIKYHGGAAENARAAFGVLREYDGPCAVESFHPAAVRYFKQEAPDVMRGQLASGGKWNKKETNGLAHFALKHLLVNAIGRPHFVAYSCPDDHTLGMWLMKHWYKPPLAAWTIRDAETLHLAERAYDFPIFEGFRPGIDK